MQKEHPDQRHGTNPEGSQKAHRAAHSTSTTQDRYNDKETHQKAETARQEAIASARNAKAEGKERRLHQAERHSSQQAYTEQDESFEETMDHVRKELPRNTRSFSRFIHVPSIEAVSDLLGKTIFRPNAILAGGVMAFVVVLGLYFYAKYMGFSLQGSETLAAFAVGWLLGILFDLFKAIFTGRK